MPLYVDDQKLEKKANTTRALNHTFGKRTWPLKEKTDPAAKRIHVEHPEIFM